MSIGQQATDAPHWPLVRITRLWDVLQRAKDWNELCKWFFNHAGSGHCQMYWPVPKGHFVRCSSHLTFGFDLGASTHRSERPPLPETEVPLLEVKFVRLTPQVTEEVARQAGSKNMFQPYLISDDCFLGGLSTSEQGSDVSGPYEGLPVSVELRITSASLAATNAWERMEIDPTQVFIGDSVFEHIHTMLEAAPNAAIDVKETVPNQASTAPPCEGSEVPTDVPNIDDTPSSTASAESQGDAQGIDDPYDLKSRAPAVYALYRTTELCSRNPGYVRGHSATDKRKQIARKVLTELVEASPSLLDVFQKTRLAYSAKLIDPERDPNAGLPEDQRREWPTAAAKKLLLQVDERRPSFVNPTLELVIYAAEHWLTLPVSPSGDEKSRVPALDAWLAKHGLAGSQERKTLFPIITFDGVKFQSAPESAAPSPSHAPASGGRRASRRRV